MLALIPEHDCSLCPRLVDYRLHNQLLYPDGWNAPIPPWGNIDSEFLIVGLAPGVRGANLTGRPFTGDFAGELLYNTLIKYGFAEGNFKAHPNDGLQLKNCRILNAVRCVPPENKPISQEENNCRAFLKSEILNMRNLKIILALGVVAHNNILKCFGYPISKYKFVHHQILNLKDNLRLINSYHVSRYNTSTKLLTQSMFEQVIESIQTIL